MSLSFSVFNKGSLINVVGVIVARYRTLNRRSETKEEVREGNQSPILACSQLGHANPLSVADRHGVFIKGNKYPSTGKVTLESRRQIQICLEVGRGGRGSS